MDAYRVFISYSHQDREQATHLVSVLPAGVVPMWDMDLAAGRGFTDQIKAFIAHSHVFLLFMGANSTDRSSWVHQEIGYATALNVPILPVTTGALPSGIIHTLQAVRLTSDLANASEKLTIGLFEQLVDSARERPATFECPEDNLRRAMMLAEYAEQVRRMGWYGRLRQKASLTSFHLPTRGPKDPIWRRYFPAAVHEGPYLFECLQAERVSLERHARHEGCRLIIDPASEYTRTYGKHGNDSIAARVSTLLAFLEDRTVEDVRVAVNKDIGRQQSLTVVGDWFSSEAVSSGANRILREALFTRHAHTVREQVREFDDEFHELLRASGWAEENSRQRASEYLRSYLDELAGAQGTPGQLS